MSTNYNASIGIGSIVIFIATIIIAGIAASVIMQTMDNLGQQAKKTGSETIRDISGGLKVIQVTGYNDQGLISKLSIFTEIITASEPIDMYYTTIILSNSNQKVFLSYNQSCFNNTLENDIFGSIIYRQLNSNEFGLVVIRDIDSSITAEKPILNKGDLVGLLVNTSTCLSGINTNIHVTGKIYPEFGLEGFIEFTTPGVFIKNIIDLQ
jgi:archaellin